jgi:integrase
VTAQLMSSQSAPGTASARSRQSGSGSSSSSSSKQLGAQCPDLSRRRHGTWCCEIRLDTTTGRRKLKRSGFDLAADASAALDKIRDLVKLAGDDERARRKIGDMIFEKSARGGELPAVGDVRRRLGLRREDLGASDTFGAAWPAWLAGKKALRPSSAKRLGEIGDHWLIPVLADIAVDRITGEHCAMLFERIDLFNEEIEAAREEKRAPVLPGDVRQRARVIGVATQHRIYAALREFFNYHLKKTRVVVFNPVYAVELEPETRGPVRVWTPEQVGRFLECHRDDRLYWLWELALLRGFRRGELAGMADDAFDPAAALITVNVALLLVGSKLVWGKPKSRAGERVVGLDADSVREGKAHRSRRRRERLTAGPAWEDSGRMFTTGFGAALGPDWISRRFREMAAEAGVPVIKFHAARHTAATLALQAKVDVKIVSEQLGHSTERITRDLYQHVSVQMQVGAAETVRSLLPERKARETGS